ncbi:MAG: tRNA lysidine(34) synthetase TilS [Pseudanabaenaceae cyanobacterium]
MPPIAKRLRAKLGEVLRQYHLLPKGADILVAVSGGQDSVCLLQLLVWWQKQWRWRLVVGHCYHRWQVDSPDNVKQVQDLADRWGLPFVCQSADPIPKGEAEARNWRYQALAELAIANHCQFVATGHTLSDRAETLLYNLIRGSGSRGLGALTWMRPLAQGSEIKSEIKLVRPLLGISRQETGAFCQALNLPIYWDRANEDWHYSRNRIRLELIPYLKTHFNPQVETVLAQTAELLHADHTYLESLAQQFWHSHNIDEPKIDRYALRTHPPALLSRIIRQYLEHHTGQATTYDHVAKFINLLFAPSGTQSDPFPTGLVAIVDRAHIKLKGSAMPQPEPNP